MSKSDELIGPVDVGWNANSVYTPWGVPCVDFNNYLYFYYFVFAIYYDYILALLSNH